MGDRRLVWLVGLSLLVAVVSAAGVWRLVRTSAMRQQGQLRPVVVAAVDLVEGQQIAPADLRVVRLPAAAVAREAYHAPDSVSGRIARVPIFAGEAVVPGRLAPVGAGAGLEVKIAAGRRAMAVKIDEVAGLAGLIQPNSRVDVLVTLRRDGVGESQEAKLFMSNMRVLSMGSQLERGPDGRPVSATTAALEVTPEESERLAVAANQGKIQLVLRGFGDSDSVITRGASAQDLIRQLAVAPRAAPPPPKRPPPRPTVVATLTRPVLPSGPPVPAAPRPSRPDSAVIQVYRRDRVSQQTIARADTARPDSSTQRTPRLP